MLKSWVKWQAVFLMIISSALYAAVNENTGSMFLSVPLFTVAGNSVSLPINLGYSAGITLHQRASWVGLGFDLSLPFVERIPVGSADEKTGAINTCNDLSIMGYQSNKIYSKLIVPGKNGYIAANPATGDFTNEQDIYLLSANFASGRMLCKVPASQNEPMRFYMQSYQDLNIVYRINDQNDIYKWEITDETGTTYIFGQPVSAKANPASSSSGISEYTGAEKSYTSGTIDIVANCKQSYYTYVNKAVRVNRRWYLTEIRSPGGGESITITYQTDGPTDTARISDLYYYNVKKSPHDTAATGVFKYTVGSTSHASFNFGYDNYIFYPVYPYEIISPRGKAQFILSNTYTPDTLAQGKRRIDSIALYSKSSSNTGPEFVLSSFIKFNYDANGLDLGHPYSSGSKGLLCLNSITKTSADGTKSLPVASFYYASNPGFADGSVNYYRHDFFGYYQNTDLKRSGGNFTYPQGQSSVGTPSAPGAEAWSVDSVKYGNGMSEKYIYEPDTACTLSTSQAFTTPAIPLRPGFRVNSVRTWDGVSTSPIVTTYQYSFGYTGHNFALLPTLTDFYALLNTTGDIKTYIANVEVLSGARVFHTTCLSKSSIAGYTKKYYLSPSSIVPVYESPTNQTMNIYDVVVTDGDAINSLGHYRCALYKTEYYKQGTSTNPVKIDSTTYAINYNLFSYTAPKVAMNNASAPCDLGNPTPGPMPLQPDNHAVMDFIGYLKEISHVTITNGLGKYDSTVYNDASMLPQITRTTNSGAKKVSQSSYCFQNTVYGNLMGETGSHMLSQPCQDKTYEKTVADNDMSSNGNDVRSATANTWCYDKGSSVTGSIIRERWNNITQFYDYNLWDLTNDVRYTYNVPDTIKYLTSFDCPQNVGDNYGTRVRGYIVPPITGNYTFWIASDERGELWLSTTDDPLNKVLIAYNYNPTGYQVWTTYTSQQSAAISLTAGKYYYIEALHLEYTGNDWLSVGWQLPDGTYERPIPGKRLAPSIAWVPYQSYTWYVAKDGNGLPLGTYGDFNFSNPASDPNWKLANTVQQYNGHGIVLQSKTPLSGSKATVLRNDCDMPIGSIVNGGFMESGIFTGDYQCGPSASHYWDSTNGWKKGEYAGSTIELVTTSANVHFGEKVIHVSNDSAAIRNNRIIPGRAYIMTAWVNVPTGGGSINMGACFCYANAGHENDWPQMSFTVVSTPAPISATPITAGVNWQFMRLDIPASVTAQLAQIDPNKVWYVRAWVGNWGSSSNNAYVDDIRFYPSDALVTTSYNSAKWQRPVLSVDANNNPGLKVAYDDFGRPIAYYKFNKSTCVTTQVQGKIYRLMGEP